MGKKKGTVSKKIPLPTTKAGWRQEYLTFDWRLCRARIIERDKFKCTHCGKKKRALQVHHLYYDPTLHVWEYPPAALITLCVKCHKEEHAGKNISDFYKKD
jgi:5-methylcytosine-specific restriction endonuclease McrA